MASRKQPGDHTGWFVFPFDMECHPFHSFFFFFEMIYKSFKGQFKGIIMKKS